MSAMLSDAVRQILSQSLPLIEARKEVLVDHMQARLDQSEEKQGLRRARANASILVETLIVQARRLLQTGALGDLDRIRREFAARAITGRTYSRFGDALVPILKDILGPNLPSRVPGAWCDAFWMIVRQAASGRRVIETA